MQTPGQVECKWVVKSMQLRTMSKALRIGLLLFPDCMPAGLLSFADLMHATNRRTGRMIFETCFVGLQTGPVECGHGVTLNATDKVNSSELDAILVPGFWAESAHHVERLWLHMPIL